MKLSVLQPQGTESAHNLTSSNNKPSLVKPPAENPTLADTLIAAWNYAMTKVYCLSSKFVVTAM